jgi:hypothetical protein
VQKIYRLHLKVAESNFVYVRTEIANKMQQCINIYYSMFIWSSTCFGWHTAHHQELKIAPAASGFAYVMLLDVGLLDAVSVVVGYFCTNNTTMHGSTNINLVYVIRAVVPPGPRSNNVTVQWNFLNFRVIWGSKRGPKINYSGWRFTQFLLSRLHICHKHTLS